MESMTGWHGVDVTDLLPIATAKPFALAFVPWLIPQSSPLGSLAASSSTEFSFSIAGPVPRQGWITVSASGGDVANLWHVKRHVRIVQRIYAFAWRIGPWGPCSQQSRCVPGMQRRTVECIGSDGIIGAHSSCETWEHHCEDSPYNWVDRFGTS